MRILDEKIDNVLDTAHFRFVQLDGDIIKVFNRTPDEYISSSRAYCVEFYSEDEARVKYNEIKKEAGWFAFDWNNKPTLLNTFGFGRTFINKTELPERDTYSIVFYNSENDEFSINYGEDYDAALNSLKGLINP